MNLSLCLAAALWLTPVTAEPKSVVEETKTVVAAVVKAAEENAAKGQDKLDGDALADFYVRRAAVAARDSEVSPKAFLLALGVALDDSDLLRKNILLSRVLRQIESDQERNKRLKVLGNPTLRKRHDWLLHFAVSAALTSQLGTDVAEQIGIAKELSDSRGGSGFSFADLAADYSGVAFAQRLLDKEQAGKKMLAAVADGFKGDDFLPTLDALEDGLPAAKLQEKYGKVDDPRFIKRCEGVRELVKQSPGFMPSK
jgi:hypothetical protein